MSVYMKKTSHTKNFLALAVVFIAIRLVFHIDIALLVACILIAIYVGFNFPKKQ